MNRILFWFASGCGALLVLVLVTNLVVYQGSKAYIYDSISDAPNVQAALIPGAAVYPNGSLSPIFTDRVDEAIAVYTAGKVSKILVSGDNSTVSHNEVNPVRIILLEKGIPDEDIFLDHAGFDTYSSMYRARDIFGVSSMLITTQSFHLPRAVFIARRLGIDAHGINADVGHILFRNYIREIFANEKVVIDLLLQRKPKYLGEKIPIGEDKVSPASKDDLIIVYTPLPNAIIESPLSISGSARGNWYFEADFPVKLYDDKGILLGIMPVQAEGEWMTRDYVPFRASLIFTAPSTPAGVLVFEKSNASGLPEHDNELRIPVRFKTELDF